eukprot:g1227.t1
MLDIITLSGPEERDVIVKAGGDVVITELAEAYDDDEEVTQAIKACKLSLSVVQGRGKGTSKGDVTKKEASEASEASEETSAENGNVNERAKAVVEKEGKEKKKLHRSSVSMLQIVGESAASVEKFQKRMTIAKDNLVKGFRKSVKEVEDDLDKHREKLEKGALFRKHHKSGPPRDRHISIDMISKAILWKVPSGPLKGNLALGDIVEVIPGATTKALKRKHIMSKNAIPSHSFTIVAKNRNLDLEAAFEDQRDFWVNIITKVINQNKLKESARKHAWKEVY